MEDQTRINQELLDENAFLKQRIQELEYSESGHKQTEEMLRESEEKNRILLSESPDPTFSFTPEGQYRYVNRAFAEGVGKPFEDIIGKRIWDEILMEARILAVSDVVESMASRRPYRPALGIDAAIEEISKERDILYDPEVVDACLKLFHEKRYSLN